MPSVTPFPSAASPRFVHFDSDSGYRPLRCIGEVLLPSAVAVDLAHILDVDPDVDSWRCLPFRLFGAGRGGVTIEVQRGAERERLLPVDGADCDPATWDQAACGSAVRIVTTADLDPVRLQNARLVLPYARWRVSLDDRIRLPAVLDEEGSVTLADCLSIFRNTARPVAAVASLALGRVVDLDLDEPLGSRTRVIRRPD